MTTVMVVDYAAFMRMRCKKLLAQSGYDVREATGAQAVETYKDNKPDIVLLDITMPDMDGLMALKELKRLTPTPELPWSALWVSSRWLWRPSSPGPKTS